MASLSAGMSLIDIKSDHETWPPRPFPRKLFKHRNKLFEIGPSLISTPARTLLREERDKGGRSCALSLPARHINWSLVAVILYDKIWKNLKIKSKLSKSTLLS